jgi:uncharacterized membrane protein
MNGRFIALGIAFVMIILGAFGWKLMRDAIFSTFDPAVGAFSYVQFIFGLIIFIVCIALIAGYILHRDRKRNLVQPRFMKKVKDKERETK